MTIARVDHRTFLGAANCGYRFASSIHANSGLSSGHISLSSSHLHFMAAIMDEAQKRSLETAISLVSPRAN